jgi:polyisoprenoid-binding protein YceI
MKFLRLTGALLALALIIAMAAVSAGRLRRSSAVSERVRFDRASSEHGSLAAQRYTLDSSQSKFIAHAMAGGLFWFKGHDHLVAVREFSGEAELTPEQINPASLQITAKTESMAETSSVFTEAQKQIINKELREIVLQPDQYPAITFRSTQVNGKKAAADQYEMNITGELTLHGTARQITIPTKVTVTGGDLRAVGEFSIDRSNFNVKATSAFHGLVRVRDKIKFNFDIVGHRV